MTDKEKLNAIRAEVEKYIDAARKAHTNITEGNFAHLLSFIDFLQEEPVSEEMQEAIDQSFIYYENHGDDFRSDKQIETAYRYGFKAGAQWKEKSILKVADGEDLPEYDRGVIVLTQPYPLEGSEFAVSFAHRPDPKGWDGKSLISGKIEHYTPKTYDKGGWNIPDVIFWLDFDFSKSM